MSSDPSEKASQPAPSPLALAALAAAFIGMLGFTLSGKTRLAMIASGLGSAAAPSSGTTLAGVPALMRYSPASALEPRGRVIITGFLAARRNAIMRATSGTAPCAAAT